MSDFNLKSGKWWKLFPFSSYSFSVSYLEHSLCHCMFVMSSTFVLFRFLLLWKASWPKTAWRENEFVRLILPYHSPSGQAVIAGSHCRQSLQGPKQTMEGCCLLSFSSPWLAHPHETLHRLPRSGTIYVGQALSYQSLIKKMLRGLVYRPIWWKAFSQLRFSLSDDSCMCQIDKRTNQCNHIK